MNDKKITKACNRENCPNCAGILVAVDEPCPEDNPVYLPREAQISALRKRRADLAEAPADSYKWGLWSGIPSRRPPVVPKHLVIAWLTAAIAKLDPTSDPAPDGPVVVYEYGNDTRYSSAPDYSVTRSDRLRIVRVVGCGNKYHYFVEAKGFDRTGTERWIDASGAEARLLLLRYLSEIDAQREFDRATEPT